MTTLYEHEDEEYIVQFEGYNDAYGDPSVPNGLFHFRDYRLLGIHHADGTPISEDEWVSITGTHEQRLRQHLADEEERILEAARYAEPDLHD